MSFQKLAQSIEVDLFGLREGASIVLDQPVAEDIGAEMGEEPFPGSAGDSHWPQRSALWGQKQQ